MFLYQFTKFLGWTVVTGFAFGMCNWLFKFVHRRWVSKWSQARKPLADSYRNVMKMVVKFHRVTGLITASALLAHFILMFQQIGLSLSGLAAMSCLFAMVGLGIHGAKFAGNKKGKWLLGHRALGVILILAIGVHVLGQ